MASPQTQERPQNLRSLTDDELDRVIFHLNQPAFRSKQVRQWIWEKNVTDFDQMTNIPSSLRQELAHGYTLTMPVEVARQQSADGSRKYLLAMADGVRVECVGMPSKGHLSVCVSTQAGCGMGCAFCATGKLGLTRSLEGHEIYDQVTHVARDFDMRVGSVVFMGQGEPFANYDATLFALRRLNNPDCAGIGARHLTVSTCGVLPGIAKFAGEPEQFTLAVSLHSAIQRTRDALMPGAKRWSLAHLHSSMAEYAQRTGRRPTYEFALIGGVNDTDDELQALCEFCAGTLCHVNLINLNEVEGSKFVPSRPGRDQEFVNALTQVGVETTIRMSRGGDIDAACGQLHLRTK